MPLERKSQVRPVLSLILFVIVLSSFVFAAESDEGNISSNSTIRQITQIIDFVFNAFGLSARLVSGNSTPAAGQELGFYENDTFIASAVTKDDGYASVNYSSAYGSYNFSAIFNGNEFLMPAKSFLAVDFINESIPTESDEKIVFGNHSLNATRAYLNESVIFYVDIYSITTIDRAIFTGVYPDGEEVNRTLLQSGSGYSYAWEDTVLPGIYSVIGVYAKAGNVSNQTRYDNLTFEIIAINDSGDGITDNLTDGNVTDLCANVSCPNACDATTLLKEGNCENGMCKYTRTMNSTECGYAETDYNNIDNITLPPSNNMTINATNNETLNASFENRTNVTIDETQVMQGRAEIGVQVIWKKRILVRNNMDNEEMLIVNITLDASASNVSVNDNNTLQHVTQKIKKNSIASATKKEFEFAGRLKALEEKEYEVTYETAAPEKTEDAPTASGERWTKKVTISSDYSYMNVLSYTDITEAERENIHLFWNVNNLQMDVTANSTINVSYADMNGNGKIDRIYWNVPHLSSQVFEVVVDLTVINVQSYPTVGGNWTVMFTTTGTANLTIRTIDGTTFGDGLPEDLEFLDLTCGGSSLKKQLISRNSEGNSLTYYDLYATREEIVARIAELNETINGMNGE